jgi:Rrf2 family protein
MLKLSSKQRYAVRIIVFLASRDDQNPARKSDIARAEDIPPDYVEQICGKLRAADLVQSHRGKYGGFSLAKAPKAISVRDVLSAVDGRIAMAPCAVGDCRRTSRCVTRRLWDEASRTLNDMFGRTTIASLADEARRLSASRALTFEI